MPVSSVVHKAIQEQLRLAWALLLLCTLQTLFWTVCTVAIPMTTPHSPVGFLHSSFYLLTAQGHWYVCFCVWSHCVVVEYRNLVLHGLVVLLYSSLMHKVLYFIQTHMHNACRGRRISHSFGTSWRTAFPLFRHFLRWKTLKFLELSTHSV